MSDGITIRTEGDTVLITTTVGEKVARVRVTRTYASQLAAQLVVASLGVEPGKGKDGRYVDA